MSFVFAVIRRQGKDTSISGPVSLCHLCERSSLYFD
jgi:hypothetical protein